MSTCKVIPVIFCTKSTRGTGKSESDPVREITEILDLDGNTIVEHDPFVRYTVKDIFDFWMFSREKYGKENFVFEEVFKLWEGNNKIRI